MIVLTEPGCIQNKWLGDGFGVSRADLEVVNAIDAAKSYGIDLDPRGQENMMRMGNYHSGPIQRSSM